MERTNDERVWTNLRFALLLLFSSVVVFTILGKYVFRIPVVESERLIQEIKTTEQILELQNLTSERVKTLYGNIDSLNFTVQQVQRLDEIKAEMTILQDVYRRHNSNSKYIFGLHSFRVIKNYFDIKEELTGTRQNNRIIEKYLEECKANL